MKTFTKRILLLASILLIWDITAKHVNPLFIPEPVTVFDDLIGMIHTGQLIKAIEYSFLRITAATFISGAIAFPIAILVYNSRIAKDILNPIISVMRYIPVTAFYPLLIMWFGIDEMMKIVFLFIATFVYMMPSVVLCLEEVNNDLIDTGLTIGMSKLQTIWRIQIPASLPGVLNSYIMMYGIGFTYIAVAETINAQYGLGYIIQQSSSRGRTDLVFMAIIVIMIISVIYDVGLVCGRFQTFHKGHEKLIDTGLLLCDRMLILVGSAQECGTERNPLNVNTRIKMIREVYGDDSNIMIYALSDLTDENDITPDWGRYLLQNADRYIYKNPDVMIYGNDDSRSGWFDKKDLKNTTELIINREELPISGTMLRALMIQDKRREWMTFVNPKLHKMYDEIRSELMESIKEN